MKQRLNIQRKRTVSLILLASLTLSVISCLFSGIAFADEDTTLDLSNYSERYLSDLAISDGGSLSLDNEGNVLFSISSTKNKLRFKCTGAFSTGEQNAVCIKLRNNTESTRISVSVTFMDYNGDTYTEVYKKTASSKESDSYIFIQSPQDLFVAEIDLSPEGVGSGSLSVMGIWHCYYYFANDIRNENAGTLSKLEYSNDGSSVTAEGSIHHDISISSKNSTIELYRLLPGESVSNEFIQSHKPCAKSQMSISFSFSVNNISGDDYASSYALVIVSEDGKIEYIIEDKAYPTVNTATIDHGGFKGVASTLEYLASKTYSDTLVIDIPTDKVISDRLNGYLYSFCSESYCFDSDMLNNIDRRITSASSGTRNIYFRLTLSDDSDTYGTKNAVYDADGELARELYALIKFLCERYSDNICGFIVGNKFDIPQTYQNLDNVSYEEYLRRYSDYISIVSSSARNTLPGTKVIVPLSSNNSRIYGDSDSKEKYPLSSTLISMLEIYSMINSAPVTLMVCDDSYPSAVESTSSPSDHLHSEDYRVLSGEIMNISANNTKVFEELILSLTGSFPFVDNRFFFSWEPYGLHSKNEYELAYAYNYFHLCSNENVYAFICDFINDEKLQHYEKSEHMADVMTAMGGENAKSFANSIAKNFTDFSFANIPGYLNYSAKLGSLISLPTSQNTVANALGEYNLSDLHRSSTLSNWRIGAYTQYISMASVLDGKRSVKAMMTLPDYSSEFAEIVYTLDRPLDLSAINNISLSLMITTVGEETSMGYTIRVLMGGTDVKCISESEINAGDGENFTITLNTESISDKSISYIKICVQNNSGYDDDIITNVISVNAYSNTLTSEQLEALFLAESDNDITVEPFLGSERKNLALVALAAVAAVAVFAIIVYRKNVLESAESDKDKNDKK